MIFQHTWEKIANGQKTQTRRLAKAGERLSGTGYAVLNKAGRERWSIGGIYSVQPAHGKPAIWWRQDADGIHYAHVLRHDDDPVSFYEFVDARRNILKDAGYKMLQIRITDIRQQDVRRISEADARAEGFVSSLEFLRVWCEMHDQAAIKLKGQPAEYLQVGDRPANLYQAWALNFEVVRDDR